VKGQVHMYIFTLITGKREVSKPE